MQKIGDRITCLIKAKGLSQRKFGETIGVSSGALSQICTGRTSPSASTVKSICLSYNINRNWLLTGEGEMFNAQSEAEELAYLMGAVMYNEEAEYRSEMVRIILDLPDEAIDMIEEFTRKRLDAYYKKRKAANKKKEKQSTMPPSSAMIDNK